MDCIVITEKAQEGSVKLQDIQEDMQDFMVFLSDISSQVAHFVATG